jgi:pantoate--beta-alanine ligase
MPGRIDTKAGTASSAEQETQTTSNSHFDPLFVEAGRDAVLRVRSRDAARAYQHGGERTKVRGWYCCHFLRDAAVGGRYSAGVKVVRTAKEMQAASAEAKRSSRRVALVPTMGALHEGHIALIRKAREQDAVVAVSIYVNPMQFGPDEDFKHYPRNLDGDCRICELEKVDLAFAPSDDEMYPGGNSTTWIDETKLTRRFEGEKRPGHFCGVCTIVAKLFNIIQPDIAVFGQKDYQQWKVIERMVRDLRYPVEIVSVPTVRESDGLAASSRNQYLSAAERPQATVLWKALGVARDLFNGGEHNPHRLEAAMMRTVTLAPAARLDYAAIADAETLEPVHEARPGDVALIAAVIGKTRLIDNAIL